jgi:hypothetical protein
VGVNWAVETRVSRGVTRGLRGRCGCGIRRIRASERFRLARRVSGRAKYVARLDKLSASLSLVVGLVQCCLNRGRSALSGSRWGLGIDQLRRIKILLRG